MSLKTKIRGFTAWVNLRLKPYEHLMNDVIIDLLSGTNMKFLLFSMTGRDLTKMDNFDTLTQSQLMTRIEMVLDELKKCQVVPQDLFVDTRMFAMRSSSHMFELLWKLVCHDIWFVWERLEFLQHTNDDVLCKMAFKWIPQPPPIKKKKLKKPVSLLSGFGGSSEPENSSSEKFVYDMSDYVAFPDADNMKKFKQKKRGVKLPRPDECIMEMVNSQLKNLFEGRKLHCLSIDDLVDSRVLCALMNSFIPNTFTAEVLLNDRWPINKVLRTMEKMLYMESLFDSADLCEADSQSVCAYFGVFFMLAFKYRQSQAVCRKVESLRRARKDAERELAVQGDQQKSSYSADIMRITEALERLEKKFDVDFCFKWSDHIFDTVKQLHKDVKKKIADRFDVIDIHQNITINDLCLSNVINLHLTNGSGFYKTNEKEMLSDARKLVLREKASGQFIDNFTSKDKEHVRRLLKLPLFDANEVDPLQHPGYDLYFESLSKNKLLKSGSHFLYQVFPNNTIHWQKMFFKAIRENNVDSVQQMVTFFRDNRAFLNCSEQQTGNRPLHVACRAGHYQIVLYLLENDASIDMKNDHNQTPLFSAIEGLHKDVALLLVEWGCDIHARGPKGITAFETIKNDELKDILIKAYNHYSKVVPRIIDGEKELLDKILQDHMDGKRCLNNLRSRFINGSSLLHTAAYYGRVDLLQRIVQLDVDINLLDYKGATALHRARDTDTITFLLESGIKVSMEDNEGNTPLHVKCYGETGERSEMAAITLLLDQGAKLTVRNSRGLLPIHCAAMQGRVDVLQLLLRHDKDGQIKKLLSEEGDTPPSLIHLTIANDQLDCADWLLQEVGFDTKEGELDLLMQRILSEQIKPDSQGEMSRFLLEHGANANPVYAAGNTALHYAAAMACGAGTELVEILLANAAEVDRKNDEGATALFFACQCNNQQAASVLIDHGANVRIENLHGLTAFDLIMDYEEWIECGYFTDEIVARLKAYNLKQIRDLVRAISKKIKDPHPLPTQKQHTTIHQQQQPGPSAGGSGHLPPLKRQQGQLKF